MELKELAENLGLEVDEFLELVELYVETSSADIIRLESAVRQKNIKGVVEASHSLKGSSGNLGFMHIFEVARGIEDKARDSIIDGTETSVQSMKRFIDQISQKLERLRN